MRCAVLLLVIAPGVLSRDTAVQCRSYDTLDETIYLPDPRECSRFWRCAAGRLVPGRCPAGRHFSVEALTCVDPGLSGCKASCTSASPQDSCSYHCTCLRKERRSVCPYRLQFGATLHVVHPRCLPEGSSFLLRGGKLGHLTVGNVTATVLMCDVKAGQASAPHFADCATGYNCTSDGEVSMQCPAGSLYSPAQERCEEAEHVTCTTSSRRSGCSRDTAVSTCQHTCTCAVLQGGCPARLRFSGALDILAREQLTCPQGAAFIELDKQFVATLEIHPNTTMVNHCPYSQDHRAVYFPDTSDCQKMFQCRHGQETLLSCPRNQYFDPAKSKCGDRNPAVCETAAPGTVPPPLVTADNLTCPTSAPCPAESDSTVAHLTDCTLFCKCVGGTPVLRACPPGLHFSQHTLACDTPLNAGCNTLCQRLAPAVGGTWSRRNCVAAESEENEECRLECDENYQLVGSEFVKCTTKGWHGTGGLNAIPSCKTPQEIAVDIVNKINETLTRLNQSKQHAALLFILDESGSVKTPNFRIEKDFVSALVNAFPLSQERSAGVVSFSGLSAVDIGLTETSTCNFLLRLGRIRYSSGRTDIAKVLHVAMEEINAHATNKTTLIFLVTDGRSQTDPMDAAQVLRRHDRILFIIGVARYVREQVEPISSTYRDGSKLFFGLPNFRVFQVVSDYLKATYTLGVKHGCNSN